MHKLFSKLLIISLFTLFGFILPAVAEPEPIDTPVASVTLESEQTPVEQEVSTQESSEITDETAQEVQNEMDLGEQKPIIIDDVHSSPNDNVNLTKMIVPDTTAELTKMVKMFLKVMFAVVVSSIIIFLLLLFVRRFYAPVVTLDDLNADEDKKITLDTPQNKNEALKTFLDKTKEM